MNLDTRSFELRPITPDNYERASRLSVRKDQESLVATVQKSLADAYVYKESIFRIACWGEAFVGYVLLFPYVESEQQHVNIVRLMIDQHHQGQGHGKRLLAKSLEFIGALQPAVATVRISTLPENHTALNLYQKMGFVERGMEEGEVALYLSLSQA